MGKLIQGKPVMGRTAMLLPLALAPAALGTGTETCHLTGRVPTKARYLKFCQDYNTIACCIPGHDLENQVQFENLIEGLGPGCKNPMMYPEVRFFYCLGCDPEQPSYTSGNNIRICKSFLDKLWRDPAYDDCGVMYSNPCPDPDTWDFDPYQCGDTLLLPKAHFNDNVSAFINTFKPPGLEDFTFLSVDDTQGADHESCWIARTYQMSPAARATSPVSWAVTAALAVVGAVLVHRS